MENFLSLSVWLGAIGIFFLRVCDMSLDTIRIMFVVRGKKKVAWILGFFQSLVFVVAITSVLSNLNNPLNVIGYAAGFATGNVIGMVIEGKLAVGHIHLTIMSPMRGAKISELLRQNGFAVSELSARGRDGMVAVLHCNVLRKDVSTAETIILEADPDAVVTAEDIRPVMRGFWRA
ncbi:MAG: DUF5698 domain-containing protein [Anaerolineae bacterium]|nr:DUF5698 domain-containing protein [Anaerolineae bacterium]